ncbi:hypothetical protein WMZ97_16540 [Lentibacillus sp. N15]|uniref:hypothetical protein n=1 Tax=Lentibacillus songyuanensis TaxID=3136161 RepID=UPI0031BADA70
MAISPFSLQHSWSVHWSRTPSNFKEQPILGKVASNEQEALLAVASVGLITARQLFHLFSLNKDKVKRMVKRNRLVKHELVMNGDRRIAVYSLGINGAKIVGFSGYENNYWVKFSVNDILKRLLFLNFYERFHPNNLLPAADPFIGSIMINNKAMYVYVVRGGLNDLMMYLKWNSLNKRLILITESLSLLEQLKPFLHDIKVRAILDSCVVDKTKKLSESFYLLDGNEFKIEARNEFPPI